MVFVEREYLDDTRGQGTGDVDQPVATANESVGEVESVEW